MGIEALISIVQHDMSYASQHQMTVIECLQSKDETLKRQTLELLFRMTNMNNVEVIVDKIITFMKSEGK
jgi:AP-4 complex subunit epsilon-1